jgi:Zn-dependent protease with chaperone function
LCDISRSAAEKALAPEAQLETIAKMSTPQIVFVAGHEMGHYVLHHIPKGLTFFAVLFLLAFLRRLSLHWVVFGALGRELADSWSGGLRLVASVIVASISLFICDYSDRLGFRPVFGASSGPVRVGGEA